MLITFILGALAGLLAPAAEPHLNRVVSSVMMADPNLGDVESRQLAFAVTLLCAALIAWLMGNGGAVSLTLGAVVGVFGPRVAAQARKG